jgi:hypothetical protein
MGAWFAGQAMQATGPREDQLSAVIEEMREAIGTDAILARADVTAPAHGGQPSRTHARQARRQRSRGSSMDA